MLTNSQAYLFRSYRTLRRGVLSLSYLEDKFVRDLNALAEVEGREAQSLLEPEFAVQAVTGLRELAEETLSALAVLKQHFDSDPFFDDIRAVQSLADEKIRDEALRRVVVVTVMAHGGLRGMLDHYNQQLERRMDDYARAFVAHKTGERMSVVELLPIFAGLVEGYSFADLQYWREKLEQEEQSVVDGAPVTPFNHPVSTYLCNVLPSIAKALEVNCTPFLSVGSDQEKEKGIWPIILIAVACAILCKSD